MLGSFSFLFELKKRICINYEILSNIFEESFRGEGKAKTEFTSRRVIFLYSGIIKYLKITSLSRYSYLRWKSVNILRFMVLLISVFAISTLLRYVCVASNIITNKCHV